MVGDAPVQANAADLVFYLNTPGGAAQGPTRTMILDKFVPQPFQHLDFSRSELVSTSTAIRLAELSFDPKPLETIDVTYGGFALPDPQHQQEVMLFTREPEEMFNTLTGTMDGPTFAKQASAVRLPGALTFEYPAVTGQTGASEVDKLLDADFWGATLPSFKADDPACLSPHAAVDPPNTECGSVKSAKIIQHGFCSNETQLVDILQPIVQGLWDLFEGVMYQKSACLEPQRSWDQIVSFVRTTIDNEESQLGGFILNAAFNDHDFHTGTSDDYLRVNQAYWLRLKEGRLFAEPKPDASSQSGTNGETFLLFGLDAINTQIGQQILTQSNDRQVLAGAPCTQRGPGDASLSPDDPANSCRTFIDGFEKLVNGSPEYVALTSKEQQVVQEGMDHTTTINGERIYDNFRCRPPLSAPTVPRCEFIVRAKRLNVMPDTAELVFLDSPNDITAPAWPIYVHSGLARESLCSRRPKLVAPGTPQNFIRPYTFVDLGPKKDKALCEKKPNTCFVECLL